VQHAHAGVAVLRLYDFLPSGNCYKVRLLLKQLGVPFERIDVDILAGKSRTPAFLGKNANGRVPVLETDDGRTLAESNAILWYLAETVPEGSRYLPTDRYERAQVLQWMFFEQYSHEPYIATIRFWITELGKEQEYRDEIAKRRVNGVAALGVMERTLAASPFFVADRYSLADIALYAYTHVAHEGRFDLQPFPAVRAWIGRVAALPGHIPITDPCRPERA
jgi:glutathione S-transferase